MGPFDQDIGGLADDDEEGVAMAAFTQALVADATHSGRLDTEIYFDISSNWRFIACPRFYWSWTTSCFGKSTN